MANSPLSLGGLASGVDTNSIVTQLMALERRPETRIKAQQREAQSRQDALRDVRTRLVNLRSALDDLRSSALWGDVQTVEVNDQSKLTATRTAATGPGGYSVTVSALARAEQRTFAYTPQSADTTIATGSASISVPAGSTLDQAVAAINGAQDSPVYAVAVGGKLVLSSRQTGAANGFTASGASIAEDPSKLQPGADAEFDVDGSPGSSPSNVVANAVPGLQLTLKGTGNVIVMVGAPTPDLAAVKAKVKAFVEQYNATLSYIHGKLTEKRERGSDGALTKGFLSGEALLSGLASQLRRAVTDTYPGTLGKLADVGISVAPAVGAGSLDQDAIQGKLVLDEDRLTGALTGDRQSVRDLIGMSSGGGGFAPALASAIAPAVQSGGTLDARIATQDAAKKGLAGRIDKLERRLAQREQLLKRQFSAMETALSHSQAQGQWLAGQLAGLQKSG